MSIVDHPLPDSVVVGPFCIVSTSRIGENTVIGPYTHIWSDSVIGSGCHLEGCYIEGAQIGDNVKIWRNAHLMQDAKIGNGSLIGHGTFVADGSSLGENCRLMLNVGIGRCTHIGNGVYIGPNVVLSNSDPTGLIREVKVGDHAWIGTNAVTTAGVHIGEHAVIGAGSVVTRDVAPYAIVYGNPGKVVGDVRESGVQMARGAI